MEPDRLETPRQLEEVGTLSLTPEELDLLSVALDRGSDGTTIQEFLRECVNGEYKLFRYLHPDGGRAILAVSIIQKSKKNREFFIFLLAGKGIVREHLEEWWELLEIEAKENKCNHIGFIGVPRLSRTILKRIEGIKATHVRMIKEI